MLFQGSATTNYYTLPLLKLSLHFSPGFSLQSLISEHILVDNIFFKIDVNRVPKNQNYNILNKFSKILFFMTKIFLNYEAKNQMLLSKILFTIILCLLLVWHSFNYT